MHVAYKVYCATFISVCQVNKKKIAIFVHYFEIFYQYFYKNIKKYKKPIEKN